MKEKKRYLLLWVEDTVLLENLADDRDGRVHGVRDNEDKGTRAVLGNALGQITDDTSVDLKVQLRKGSC